VIETRTQAALVLLRAHLRKLDLGEPIANFEIERGLRVDYGLPRRRLAFELVDPVQSQATTSQDFIDRHNLAMALGYRIFRFSIEDVVNGRESAIVRRWADQFARRAPKIPGDKPAVGHSGQLKPDRQFLLFACRRSPPSDRR